MVVALTLSIVAFAWATTFITVNPNNLSYISSTASAITLTTGQGASLQPVSTFGPYQLNAWNSAKYASWSLDPFRQSMTLTGISTDTITVTRQAPSYDMPNCSTCQYSLQAAVQNTYTPVFTPTVTNTPTNSPTATNTPTNTNTPTSTPTNTPTATPTATSTPGIANMAAYVIKQNTSISNTLSALKGVIPTATWGSIATPPTGF